MYRQIFMQVVRFILFIIDHREVLFSGLVVDREYFMHHRVSTIEPHAGKQIFKRLKFPDYNDRQI